MTDNITHDPDLPYVAIVPEGSRFTTYDADGRASKDLYPGAVLGRFAHAEVAWDLLMGTGRPYELIDTTPKPKIPADAEFLHWRDEDDQPYFAVKHAAGSWETDEGVVLLTEELIGFVEGIDITVLDRREGGA